jgi:hypothetical protein
MLCSATQACAAAFAALLKVVKEQPDRAAVSVLLLRCCL